MNARVVVITDRTLVPSLAERIAQLLARVPHGSVAFQVREKDLDDAALLALTREILAVARPRGAPVWVNERLDVALSAAADGIHLPERGVSIQEALSHALAIGCSRHTAEGVVAAARSGASLVQLGPIWETPGKGAPLGVTALSVRQQIPRDVALVAVGGIDSAERAREAVDAGAAAVAVIRAAWIGGPDLIAAMVEAVEAGLAARTHA